MKNKFIFSYFICALITVAAVIDNQINKQEFFDTIEHYNDSITNLHIEVFNLEIMNDKQFDKLMEYEEKYIYQGTDPTIE